MRRLRAGFVASVLLLSGLAVATTATAPPAAAYPSDTVALAGHGFGHGRGMGQFGALGYALKGTSYTDILSHFYSNTTAGGIGNDLVTVQLVANDGLDAIVMQEHGNLTTDAGAPTPGNQAVRVRKIGPNQFAVDQAPNCNGPWQLGAISAAHTGTVTISPTAPSAAHDSMLQVCYIGSSRWYEGDILAVDGDGTARTVNRLPMESYLRGVVPRESPASWGQLGGGAGEEALKAQAVAARSYAKAENRHPWAKTCDTTSCQVYGGRAVQDGGGYQDLYGAGVYATTSDVAVSSTGGQVRMLNGGVARTEFSSSTGGFTAGGVFPAVVDEGDDVCANAAACNSNHNWTANVPVADIEAAYNVGTLVAVTVVDRTPADGGRRAKTVRIKGTSGTVDVSAETFQSKFSLKSTWFDVVNSPSGGLQGYWLVGSDGGIFTFGGAHFFGSTGGMHLNSAVLDMKATPDGGGYWLVAGDGGIFTFGNARFFGSTGNLRLNKPVVGMAPTPTGNGYWLVASDGGIFTFGDARFFGSTGNMHLNQPVVGMAPTADGNGYWLVARDGGIFTFGSAAFHGSTGNIRLNSPIIGMASAGNDGYWLVAGDGGIFTFGSAQFKGSLPGIGVHDPATGTTPTKTGAGYLIATAPGGVYSFGDAPNFGSMAEAVPGYRGRIIGIEGAPS